MSIEEFQWNRFILKNKSSFLGSFLQSCEWSEIQKNNGKKIWRLNILKDAFELKALIIKESLPFGKNYLYVPFGPIVNAASKEIFQNFLAEIKKIAAKEKSIFLKIDLDYQAEKTRDLLIELGFKKSNKEIQPNKTIILDLIKSEEKILNEMKSKTRYNIGLAKRKRVAVREGSEEKDFEIFWKMLEETARRDKFFLHPKKHYQNLLEISPPFNLLFYNKLFLAEYQGKALAGAIVNFFDETATYLHGASSNENRPFMAPYLLHWEIIKSAKANGFKNYDFWGISEKYPGVIRFKEGFGGKKMERPGAYDLAFSKFLYKIYFYARKIFK